MPNTQQKTAGRVEKEKNNEGIVEEKYDTERKGFAAGSWERVNGKTQRRVTDRL